MRGFGNDGRVPPFPLGAFRRNMLDNLNGLYTRQFRMAFLVDQAPEANNRVTLSDTETDHLGLPRPQISYSLSDHTKAGFEAARRTADCESARRRDPYHTDSPMK